MCQYFFYLVGLVTATMRHDRDLSNLLSFRMFFSQDPRSVPPRTICIYVCANTFVYVSSNYLLDPPQLTWFVSGHSVCLWNESIKYVYRQSHGWINSGSGVKWATWSSRGRAIKFKFFTWCSIVQSFCMRAFRLLACLRRPASIPGLKRGRQYVSFRFEISWMTVKPS